MLEPIDLDAGWIVLTEQRGDAGAFKESPVCRAVFDWLPEIIGDLCAETASPDNVSRARLRVALDVHAIDALRDGGFRFAVPPSDKLPFLLAANGNRAQRNAVVLHAERKLSVGGLIPAWPQMLVWFARR